MSGFLLGVSDSVPTPSLISNLKPALWRIGPCSTTTYSQAVNAGAKVQIVLSEGYGYPLNNWGVERLNS